MPTRGKPGRKPNNRGAAEKLLMEKFSEQLKRLLADPAWTIEKVRSKLGVSRMSVFNYKDGTDSANLDVLKRAHDELGFSFPYIDFSMPRKPKASKAELKKAQGVLPFLEPLRREDIRVIGKKTVDPQTLELTVQIRFPSRMAALRRR